MGNNPVREKIKKLIMFISGDDLENAKEILKDITSDYLVMKGEPCRKKLHLDYEDEYKDDEDDEEFCVTCNECGFEFEVYGDEIEDVKSCPKCGSDDLTIDECE